MATAALSRWPTSQPELNAPGRSGYEAPDDPSDAVLVTAARQGDAKAFETLIQRHYRFCFSLALSLLRDCGDAEDEVQNACVKAWERLWQYEGDGTFGAWLSRIVSNQCLMALRSKQHSGYVWLDEARGPDQGFRLEVIDQRALPEEEVGWQEVSAMLRKEIQHLPTMLREVLTLRDLRQFAMADIAVQLGISVAAAKSRLMRARAELRSRLERHLGVKGQATLIQRAGRRQAAYSRID